MPHGLVCIISFNIATTPTTTTDAAVAVIGAAAVAIIAAGLDPRFGRQETHHIPGSQLAAVQGRYCYFQPRLIARVDITVGGGVIEAELDRGQGEGLQ